VTFVRSLKEDLARRDFTINALAYDLASGVIDYFGGEADIKNRRLRAVGDPDRRLNEDALRLLRALRFSAVLSFDIEQSLADSIHRNRELLRNISQERIAAELSKMIVGDDIVRILLDYPDVFSVFIPEIAKTLGFDQKNPHHIQDVWTHTAQSVGAAAPGADPIVRLAMLFHDLGKPDSFTVDEHGTGHFYGHNKISEDIATSRLKTLRFDNDTIEAVSKLVRWHDAKIAPENLVRWLNKMGEAPLRNLLEVKKADALAQNELFGHDKIQGIEHLKEELDQLIANEQCYKLTDLMITGTDLLGLGVQEGPAVGSILDTLLEKVMDGELENDRSTLLSAAEILSRNRS
jgi:tRNA nucleotidyltransferase (CCA-adding enzyme)